MYISKLEIKNFKSFEHVVFDLNQKINVLTGINNAGKTTTLEALALWHECYRKLVRQAGRSVGGRYEKNNYILGTKIPTYISYQDITSVRSPNYEDIFFNLEADSAKPIIISVTLEGADTKKLVIPISISKADGDNYKIVCHNIDKFDFKRFNDPDFLSDPRTSIQLTYASPITQLLPIEEIHLPSKIRYLEQSRASWQVLRNRLEQLYDNGRNREYDRFIEELKLVLNNNTEEIRFHFSKDSNELNQLVKISIGRDSLKDISLLGNGTLQIIEILLSLFKGKKDLNLILLDEPDSHIHHALQKRLLDTLEKFSDNCQVLLTTHNEALIRTAQLDWVFHLERQKKAHYQPVIHKSIHAVKKGVQPWALSPIIQELTGTTSLDFINALEADKLFLVEGVDDAIRIQKLLSFKNNDKTRYAFWVADGVGAYFHRLGIMKDIFKTIKNKQTLWAKSVLVMDKDDMTDQQRNNIIDKFTNNLGIKTHIWESYNFESVLLSDLEKMAYLLTKYIRLKNPDAVVENHIILGRLKKSSLDILPEIKSIYKDETELPRICGRFQHRRKTLGDSSLGMKLSGIIEDDLDLKRKLDAYYNGQFSPENMHKICRKPQLEKIILDVFAPENLQFSLSNDFDDLFNMMDKSSILDAYLPILSI